MNLPQPYYRRSGSPNGVIHAKVQTLNGEVDDVDPTPLQEMREQGTYLLINREPLGHSVWE